MNGWKDNRNGYTFIEMMIVLLVVSIFLGAGVFSLRTFYETVQTRSFLKSLKKDLYFTQQTAVSTESFVSLVFHQGHTYIIRDGVKSLKKVTYPDHVSVEPYSMPLTITYNGRGNISQGGTLVIRANQKRFHLVFQLGKGRFYIDER
ncbi:competence type IV pilus minor pilin ComGD [Fictibacillus iocasae]|uniref:Competence type IV pilus minor pilin ComGD n=1 Tax=Fictibacillus iocasae TaxID=2715437 RepID=A0ABW2NLE4_9BACL